MDINKALEKIKDNMDQIKLVRKTIGDNIVLSLVDVNFTGGELVFCIELTINTEGLLEDFEDEQSD